MSKSLVPNFRLVALLAGLTSLAPAQQAPAADPFYESVIRAPIIPARAAADIQADLDAADKNRKAAEKAIADAHARVKEADDWSTQQRALIEDVKAKAAAAKKEKREADKVALDAQQKQLELVLEYLKKTKSAREAEMDLAQAQKDQLDAQYKALTAEDDLRKSVERIKTAGPKDPSIAKTVMNTVSLAQTTLQLMKTASDKNADVAGRAKRLADRRIELADSRNKLITEDRIRKAVESMGK